MSVEGLKKAVLDKAREEADRIWVQARKESEAVCAQKLNEARQRAANTVEEARRESARERQQALAAQEREMRLESLKAKNRLLEEAFRQAEQSFKNLPAAELSALYRRELDNTDLKGAAVLVAPKVRGVFEALLQGRARIEEDASLDAGYIIVSKEYRIDRSLGARMEEIRAEMRSRVAELLFGDSP